ncbi:MAG: hypothetical protein ACTTKL_04975 [Treponema sp.]
MKIPSRLILSIISSMVLSLIFTLIKKWGTGNARAKISNRLALPLYVFIVGIADFLLFAAIALVSNLFPNGTESLGTTIIFVSFALLGLLLVYAYFIEQYSYDAYEIQYRSFTGKKITIKWNEIESVTYNAGMQWFVIEFGGKKSRFALMLKGMRGFAQMILNNSGKYQIDPKTFSILERVVTGETI